MEKIILGLHITICVVLVIVVLLQSGKEGMGVIFGGSGSSFFGSTGAGGTLTKLTAFLAIVFIITSMTYNIMTRPKIAADASIMESIQIEKTTPPAPLVPAQQPDGKADQKGNATAK